MQKYVTSGDTETYSELNGSQVFSLDVNNNIKVYSLSEIISYLEDTNQLEQFVNNDPLCQDIVDDLDVDGELYRTNRSLIN